MSKFASYLLLIAMSLSLMACSSANNDNEIGTISNNIAKYAEAKDLKSLQSLGDSISANEKLGEAVVAQLSDTTLNLSTAALAVSVSPEKAAEILFEDIKTMKKEMLLSWNCLLYFNPWVIL